MAYKKKLDEKRAREAHQRSKENLTRKQRKELARLKEQETES